MGIEKSYNYKRISDKVTTSGIVSKSILSSIASEGYEAVINLLPENHKKSVPDEKEIVESQGILYLNIPVEFEEPKHADLDQFLADLKKIGDKKVHIHCAANWRVSAFYGIYAVQIGLWNQDEANHFILSIWNPGDYPAWSRFLNHSGLGRSEE